MTDTNHIIYTTISYLLTIGLMWLFSKKVNDRKSKDLILKVSALLTVILHYSILYVDYFTYGDATIEKSMILPVYPCNIAMWLLLITAFMKNKDGKLFKHIALVTFYLGVIGGSVGLVLNENYMSNPTFADWFVLKGLLSHSTLIFGSIYILVGRYVKIRVSNIFSVIGGLLFLILDGIFVISLHKIFKIDCPNCMFLLENPFPQLPWFNSWVLGIVVVVVIFIVTALIEQIILEKEERWYNQLFKKLDKNECNN